MIPPARYKVARLFFALAQLLLLGACSQLNCTRLEGFLGGDVNLVRLGDSVAESLIQQALPPLLARQTEQPILVTTLVDNNRLADTSDFGRSLQNNLIAGFVQRGYPVKELKLRGDLLVENDRGEFMLSRQLRELAGRQRAQAVVVGTYSLSNRVLYLSIRLVNPTDRTILAAVEERLCLDENSLRMLGHQFSAEESIAPPGEPVLDRILY